MFNYFISNLISKSHFNYVDFISNKMHKNTYKHKKMFYTAPIRFYCKINRLFHLDNPLYVDQWWVLHINVMYNVNQCHRAWFYNVQFSLMLMQHYISIQRLYHTLISDYIYSYFNRVHYENQLGWISFEI